MVRIAALVCLLSLAGCRDPADTQWKTTKGKYQALVMDGATPTDPRWKDVEAALKQVPPQSKHGAEAAKLLNALAMSRVRLRPPLAVVPRTVEGATDPDVVAARQECVRLARARADGGVTPELIKALDVCRERAEKLDALHVHGDAPPVAPGPVPAHGSVDAG